MGETTSMLIEELKYSAWIETIVWDINSLTGFPPHLYFVSNVSIPLETIWKISSGKSPTKRSRPKFPLL